MEIVAPSCVSKAVMMPWSLEVANLTLTSASKSTMWLASLQEVETFADYQKIYSLEAFLSDRAVERVITAPVIGHVKLWQMYLHQMFVGYVKETNFNFHKTNTCCQSRWGT